MSKWGGVRPGGGDAADESAGKTAVGSLVSLRTEYEFPVTHVVVRVGRWWPNAGKVLVRHSLAYARNLEGERWVYPCGLKIAEEAG